MNLTTKPKSRISLGNSGNALVLLIGANLIFFVVLIFLKVFYFMTSTSNSAEINSTLYHTQIFDSFLLPASFKQFVNQPWTLFSYMFSHENLLDLFSNMLWLVAFGYILQSMSFNKKIIPLYLYGGILGGIIFIVMNAVLPDHLKHLDFLSGAMIATTAVATGATLLTPQYKIFPMLGGGIPLWILYLVFMLINISSVANAGVAAISAIISSALIGFIVIYQLKKGNDYGEWIYTSVYKIDDLFNPERKKSRTEQEHFYKTNRKPYETKERITQVRIDEILDKINTKGYDSLTKHEKEFLQRAGKEDML
ncbi:MAG: rhomboid family intramembrane serine protease [Arachidicoccus sp.]|nr:rhomboid family intramembrane serine protease [Arachidicoccus sp.]